MNNFPTILYKIKTPDSECNCFSLSDLLTNLSISKELSKQSLILVRGLPGAGKSTLAKAICEKFNNFKRFEADMYFQKDGDYVFDKSELPQAHNWCYNQVRYALDNGQSVCVSNTFIRKWEMDKYIGTAKHFNYYLIIIECLAEYKNTHNVPTETIERMKKQWETV